MSTPWGWPPTNAVTTDQVINESSVAGATATEALNTLNTGLTTIDTSGVTNASSVPGTTATDALNALGLNVIGLQLNVCPYIPPPSAANSFDDEFSSGSADLATRGYLIINAITGAVLTRSGNINPLDATGPAAGTYWSTLSGSWLYVQGAAGLQIDILKTITLAAGDLYCARTVGSFNMSTAAAGRYCEVGLYGWTGTVMDNNNRVWMLQRDDPTAANYLQTDAGRFTAGVGVTALRSAFAQADIKGVSYTSGTTHQAIAIEGSTGRVVSQQVTGAPAAATLTRFGIRNLFSASGSAVPQIWGIDFIRKKTGGAWLIP
jgi:hypothetical protein